MRSCSWIRRFKYAESNYCCDIFASYCDLNLKLNRLVVFEPIFSDRLRSEVKHPICPFAVTRLYEPSFFFYIYSVR